MAACGILVAGFACSSSSSEPNPAGGGGSTSASSSSGNPGLPDGGGPADTGSDASTSGGPDTGSDAGDPCEGRLICDSFEGQAVGAAPTGGWKVDTYQAATVTVSDAQAFKGTRSIKFTTGATQYQKAMMAMTGAPLFGATSTTKTTLYGRMMVYLETPAANGVHWTMLAGEGPVASKPGVRAFVRYGGQVAGKLMANYDTSGAKSDCWQHSATVMPIGKWTCFAWKLSGPTNDMTLAMDGKDIADLKVSTKGQGCINHDLADVWYPPTYERAVIGWESYQQDVGHTMYVDDVILDDQPIACPQ